MSITTSLLAFGAKYLFNESADHIIGTIEKRLTDHSAALPKALYKANDRAWEAVGLALAGESLFGWVKDLFRDADMKGVRDQIKGFLDSTPTGLENTPIGFRVKATEEWNRLRKAGCFSASSVTANAIAHYAATMERHFDPARMTAAAHQAVKITAEALQAEAPHLAELLTVAPSGGSPLLVASFAFFFRRELETNSELAHGLSFDFLKVISERQERGLDLLDFRTAGILDQIAVLFDTLQNFFDSQREKLDEINAKLDHLVRLRDVPTSTSEPLRVTVTNKGELELLQLLRNQLRNLAPELIASTDWAKLGDTLAAAGEREQAIEAHEAAAAAAKASADREAEAEAEYKKFRDACESGDRNAAMVAFHRAVELAPGQFTPFDLQRYKPIGVLGIGGFGTVFLANDDYVRIGKERQPQKVAIKAMHDSGWDAVLERDLSETFDEADTLSALNHPGIVKTVNRGFGDPGRRKRPFMVMEYFQGVTLDAWLKANGPLTMKDVLVVAKQMAEAVHAAHRLGIFHRDIKPANVMIAFDEKAQQWQVKVIDFGLAVKLQVARTSIGVPAGRRAVLDRSLAGTMRYAPPEQRNELDADVGPYSDVYAWGKTCFDLLFGTTEPKLMHWKKLPDDLRDRMQELLELATVDDLALRYTSFETVLSSLTRLIDDWRFAGPRTEELNSEKASAVESLISNPHTISGLGSQSTARRTTIPIAQPVPVGGVNSHPAKKPSTQPVHESPVQKLKRIKAEVATETEKARTMLLKHDYESAVHILGSFTPEQTEFRDKEMYCDTVTKRDRLRELNSEIQKLLQKHRFHDPRMPVLVRQYLILKPNDEEMRELIAELPLANEPPANPKAGNSFTLRIFSHETDHKAGDIMTVNIRGSVDVNKPGELVLLKIPVVDRGPQPGTLTSLNWKPVPNRPNPNK